MGAIVDTNGTVSESNESNNVSAIKSFYLQAPTLFSPSVGDQFEDDDTMEDAQEIEVGVAQKHNFYDDTQDWVKIVLNDTREYTIETRNLGALLDTNLTVINVTSDTNLSDHNSGDDSLYASKITVRPALSDEFFIRVSSNTAVGPERDYDLLITDTIVANPDLYEDDDTQEDAQPIEPNTSQKHNFYDDHHDWLSFEASKDNNYTIETEIVGSEADTVVVLYDTDGTTELTRDDNGSTRSLGGSRIQWRAPSSGKYYIEILSANGETGDNRHYNVTLIETKE
jgi:hypothetical protein